MYEMALNKDLALQREIILEKLDRLLSPPQHRHFTDHSISHSKRIVENIEKILIWQPFSDLEEIELFLLFAAADLHDIGMQIPRSKLLQYPCLDELLEVSKMSRKDIVNDEKKRLEFIRDWHHLFSEYMILKSLEWNDLDLGLREVYPGGIEMIALLAKGHRKIDLDGPDFYPQGIIRPKLLAALLRLADALNCDRRRVDLARLGIFDLTVKDKLHWLLHYCVEQVNIRYCYIEICAGVPTGFSNAFRTLFVFPLWLNYYQVLDILKSHRIVLSWAPSKVRKSRLMNIKFQRIDPAGELRGFVAREIKSIWSERNIESIISTLGPEESERPELELSPYYFTGVEQFRGIKFQQWPMGSWAYSLTLFADPKVLAGDFIPYDKALWRSPIIKKEEGNGTSLAALKLEEGKRYGFLIDFYNKNKRIFLSQRGVFWIIERYLLDIQDKATSATTCQSEEERKFHLGIIGENIGAYEESMKIYLQLLDTSAEWKLEVINHLVMVYKKIFEELKNLRFENEAYQILKDMSYWARLVEKVISNAD